MIFDWMYVGEKLRGLSKPDFLIIGAQKCGTTSLFYYLSQHPNVKMPSTKEVHFFDLQYDKGIDWYFSLFPKKPFFKIVRTGEASPYYLFHPLVPERVYCYLPKIKIIVLLRNPIDRAYSHFMHQRKLGNEPLLSFEEALASESVRIAGEEKRIKLGLIYESHKFRRYSYATRGLYYVQINRWFEYFSKSQMLFIKSEDFFENPKFILNEVYNFLEIKSVMPKRLTPQNTNDYPEITAKAWETLRNFYEEDSIKLTGLLGDKFAWK